MPVLDFNLENTECFVTVQEEVSSTRSILDPLFVPQ